MLLLPLLLQGSQTLMHLLLQGVHLLLVVSSLPLQPRVSLNLQAAPGFVQVCLKVSLQLFLLLAQGSRLVLVSAVALLLRCKDARARDLPDAVLEQSDLPLVFSLLLLHKLLPALELLMVSGVYSIHLLLVGSLAQSQCILRAWLLLMRICSGGRELACQLADLLLEESHLPLELLLSL